MNNISQVHRPLIDDALLTSSSNQELTEEYLRWKQSYALPAYQRYRIWVVRFQCFVNKIPESLRYSDYVAFVHSITGQYAGRSLQFGLSIVRNYLRFFAEQGRLRFPLYLVRIPRTPVNSHQAITEDEYRILVRDLRESTVSRRRDLAILMLLHDTGMRIGELLSLRIDDIEEDRSAVIRTEKTTKQRRVYWNLDTDLVVQQFLVERVNRDHGDSDALFVANKADMLSALPITSRTVQRMLKRSLRHCGIERNLCPHSFRHAFIHRLAKLSVPDAIIAQLVGHSTPFTIAHYTKLSRPEFREYAERQLDYSESLSTKAISVP